MRWLRLMLSCSFFAPVHTNNLMLSSIRFIEAFDPELMSELELKIIKWLIAKLCCNLYLAVHGPAVDCYIEMLTTEPLRNGALYFFKIRLVEKTTDKYVGTVVFTNIRSADDYPKVNKLQLSKEQATDIAKTLFERVAADFKDRFGPIKYKVLFDAPEKFLIPGTYIDFSTQKQLTSDKEVSSSNDFLVFKETIQGGIPFIPERSIVNGADDVRNATDSQNCKSDLEKKIDVPHEQRPLILIPDDEQVKMKRYFNEAYKKGYHL